jgi:hypothetical protein
MPVEVKGVVGARKILRKLAPETLKAYNAQISAPLKNITKSARNDVPGTIENLSRFSYPGYERKSRTGRNRAFPSFESNVVRRGLTYSLAKSKGNRSGWASLVSLLNKSAAGAIIETAGRQNRFGSSESKSNNPSAGRDFIENLNKGIGNLEQTGRTSKTQGRLLGRNLVEDQGKIQGTILKVLQQITAQANAEIARLPRGN